MNKAEIRVFQALRDIRTRLPFALLGIVRTMGANSSTTTCCGYCRSERITFTRGRAYRKNDGCFIEQKNYTVVRRAVGYARYAGASHLALLNQFCGRCASTPTTSSR